MNTESKTIWLKESGSGWRAGLCAGYAESIAGNWVGLELLPEGSFIRRGETFGFLTTDRQTHDLRAPRGMKILRPNSEVLANANIARLSPEGLGWLIECKLSETEAV